MSGDQLDLDAYGAMLEAQDAEYRAKLTASQLRDYKIFSGEIAARCPNCGKRDVEIEQQGGPDMVGDTYWTHFRCCGFDGDSWNTALEYDHAGRVVDVG